MPCRYQRCMLWGVFPLAGLACRHLRALCTAVLPVLVMAAPNPALAAPDDTATASGQADVAVVQPLQLTKVRDLDFGRMASRPTAGTVTVNAASGACTTTGPILHIGGCNSAEFAGMGTRNQLVLIQIQNITQLTGPGAAMNMTNMTVDAGSDLGFTIFQILGWRVYRINPTNGIFDFRIGGTLNVNANQAPGNYQGTFNVRIEYY